MDVIRDGDDVVEPATDSELTRLQRALEDERAARRAAEAERDNYRRQVDVSKALEAALNANAQRAVRQEISLRAELVQCRRELDETRAATSKDALFRHMRSMSQDAYAEASGHEVELWGHAQGRGNLDDLDSMPADVCELLPLAETAGGWWAATWPGGERFVPMREWTAPGALGWLPDEASKAC